MIFDREMKTLNRAAHPPVREGCNGGTKDFTQKGGYF